MSLRRLTLASAALLMACDSATTPTETPPPTATSALIVEEFSVIEFQNTPGQEGWVYAPQLRVRAAPGRAATLLLLSFTIPGLGQVPPLSCPTTLSTTESSDLNGEFYGEWAFSIDGANKALGVDVTAAISFRDERGVVATKTVQGKIVAGALPSTVTGGNLAGACFSANQAPG